MFLESYRAFYHDLGNIPDLKGRRQDLGSATKKADFDRLHRGHLPQPRPCKPRPQLFSLSVSDIFHTAHVSFLMPGSRALVFEAIPRPTGVFRD